MKDAVLLALAERWVHDAKCPEAEVGSPEAAIDNAKAQGAREAKRECADTLRTLIQTIGETESPSDERIRYGELTAPFSNRKVI